MSATCSGLMPCRSNPRNRPGRRVPRHTTCTPCSTRSRSTSHAPPSPASATPSSPSPRNTARTTHPPSPRADDLSDCFDFTKPPSRYVPIASTVTAGSSGDTVTVNLSEDAYQGNAQFSVALDGKARARESAAAFLKETVVAEVDGKKALEVKRLKKEDGPTAVEYAVMLALIIVVCITAITTLGSNANNTFSYVGTKIAGTGS